MAANQFPNLEMNVTKRGWSNKGLSQINFKKKDVSTQTEDYCSHCGDVLWTMHKAHINGSYDIIKYCKLCYELLDNKPHVKWHNCADDNCYCKNRDFVK